VCVAQQEVVVVDPIPALEPPAAANKSTGWRAGLGGQVAACASVCLCVCVFVYGAEGREEARCSEPHVCETLTPSELCALGCSSQCMCVVWVFTLLGKHASAWDMSP